MAQLGQQHLGQLGRRDHVHPVDELPAPQLSAIGQIEILGDRVVLPAASVGDGFAAPHATSAREVEEEPSPEARSVLDQVVTVEHQRLDAGEQRRVTVEVGPACLHHPDLGIPEVAHQGAGEVGARHEIGVENRHQIALDRLEPVVQGASLVADSVGTMDVLGVEATVPQLVDLHPSQGLGLVDGIIEDLDMEAVFGVVHQGHRLEQPHDHGGLVENR